MRDSDRLLGDALAEARTLHPSPPSFDGVQRRARRRTAVRRSAVGALLAVVAVTLLAATGLGDDEPETSVAVAPADVTEDTLPLLVTTTTTTTPGPPVAPTSGAEPRPERPTESTTTTTAPPSTTTTAVVRSEDDAPAAYARGDGDEVAMATGSSCWRPASEDRAALCADTTAEFADEAPRITVAAGGTVVVRWTIDDQPIDVWASARDGRNGGNTQLEAPDDNPSAIAADLAPGEYVLIVSSTWKQGDVLHGVRLLVK